MLPTHCYYIRYFYYSNCDCIINNCRSEKVIKLNNCNFENIILSTVPPSCGSPDKLLNTTIVGDSYQVGASIAYRCPEGHMLIGDQTRECKKDGFWSGGAPSCKCKLTSDKQKFRSIPAAAAVINRGWRGATEKDDQVRGARPTDTSGPPCRT